MLHGPDNLVSIVISAESSQATIACLDSQPSSEPEYVTPSRVISTKGDILKVFIPLQGAMGIPPPPKDENLEEMLPKGQKRTRKRDGDSGSEDEASSEKAFVSPSATSKERNRPSSAAEVSPDFLDTTVPVNIDPDVVVSHCG